ncbi:MAG TPA: hypothetical protein VFF27_07035 [Bacteroidia bacterium]|jgi:hypothetical protein|nr:hypothetical protein [Bacteroidia bacterium]
MLTQKTIILESTLKVSEIISRLENITSPSLSQNLSIIKFEGKIGTDEFTILPTYNYNHRDRVRPQITGHIVDDSQSQKRKVHLQFSVSIGLKIVLIAVIILNLIIFFLTYRWPILVAVLGFLVIFFILYFQRISESVEIFKKLLQ